MSCRLDRRAFSLIDLLVALVLVLIIAGWCLGQVAALDDAAQRAQCKANLRQIGLAMWRYADANRGAFPRTLYDVQTADKPVWRTPYEEGAEAKDGADPFAKDDSPVAKYRPRPNDVTAALFLLVRTQQVPAQAFVCPGTRATPWDFGGGSNKATSWTNWNGAAGLAEHLSYSYTNPYPSAQATAAGYEFNSAMKLAAEFAVLADMNPGTREVTTVSLKQPPDQRRQANSPNHRRAGQNVLCADGHVDWQTFVFAGPFQDNIYSFGPSGVAKGADGKGGDGIVGSPTGPGDCVLLPTALDLKIVGEDDELKAAAPTK